MITKQDILNILNEDNTVAPESMKKLIDFRVEATDGIMAHPEIQAGRGNYTGKWVFGLLGIINGILIRNGDDPIYARISRGKIEGFFPEQFPRYLSETQRSSYDF